jgi:hypothetical protein
MWPEPQAGSQILISSGLLMHRKSVFLGLFWLDVIVHLPGQLRAGAIQQPQAAEGVFHQVADDPVRGEELGGGGDVLGRDLLVLLQSGEHLVLLLGDVELVEPADHLDILAGIRRHRLARQAEDGVAREQILGHQQLGVVVDALEQERHGPVPGVADGHHQQAVGLVLWVVTRRSPSEQIQHVLAASTAGDLVGDEPLFGLGEDLRLGLPLGG